MATRIKSTLIGLSAVVLLLVVYFSAVGLISGIELAIKQFSLYWYFLLSLSAGFGVQVGLYSYLRTVVRENVSGRVITTTGATSTVAMISCCAHYLVNILPILGISWIATFISQYQIKLFLVGIILNLFGIIFIYSRLAKINKHININGKKK